MSAIRRYQVHGCDYRWKNAKQCHRCRFDRALWPISRGKLLATVYVLCDTEARVERRFRNKREFVSRHLVETDLTVSFTNFLQSGQFYATPRPNRHSFTRKRKFNVTWSLNSFSLFFFFLTETILDNSCTRFPVQLVFMKLLPVKFPAPITALTKPCINHRSLCRVILQDTL